MINVGRRNFWNGKIKEVTARRVKLVVGEILEKGKFWGHGGMKRMIGEI